MNFELQKSIYILEAVPVNKSLEFYASEDAKSYVISKFIYSNRITKDYIYEYAGLAVSQIYDSVNEAKLACAILFGSELLKTKNANQLLTDFTAEEGQKILTKA